MNLNEVKKHVYFNLILYILIGLCLLLSLIAILITPVHAAELKSYEITSGIKNTSNCGTGSLGYYCYGQWATSYTNWYKTSFGSTNGYPISSLAIDLNGTITYQNAPTTIEIYSPNNSFKNTTYSCSWSGSNQPSSCTVYRASSNHININFVSGLGSPQYLYIDIGNVFNTSSWLDNISINKVIANQSINDPNASVIANQNENTAEIINSQNENTNSLINNDNIISQDNINTSRSQMQNMCSNSINIMLTKGKRISEDGFTLIDDPLSFYTSDYFAIGSYSTIYFQNSGSTPINGYYLFAYNQNKQLLDYWLAYSVRTMPTGTYYIKLATRYPGTLLTGGSTCVKAEDQINSYLRDDTDPTVNQQGINNALSSVDYSNPLDYLLTLPTHLLQKINTVLSANTCSRVSFGSLYGTELYLPCIDFASLLGSNIWNTIDLFVGVGLLVMVIKHFYETISNIITLGKEKEVQGKLDLPTPMQFLASILGGGRS